MKIAIGEIDKSILDWSSLSKSGSPNAVDIALRARKWSTDVKH
jgi:hypothetical protein